MAEPRTGAAESQKDSDTLKRANVPAAELGSELVDPAMDAWLAHGFGHERGSLGGGEGGRQGRTGQRGGADQLLCAGADATAQSGDAGKRGD